MTGSTEATVAGPPPVRRAINGIAGEMPEVVAQDVVVEAMQVAAARGMPLGIGAAGATPAGGPAEGERMPQSLPWSGLSQDAIGTARQVDILRALSAILPHMEAVEAELEQLITSPVKLIADIASHTLGAGGKRLRPALTILAAQACGSPTAEVDPRVITCAALVELTHTTTLLHDDVVDAAEMRRGKPSANLIWGSETSVLVGDYLFAQVFVTASQQGRGDLMFPLANATAQMCAGELLETQTRGFLDMTEKQYLEIVALKTASLTECACRLGAVAAGASPAMVESLAGCGRDLGMAFQIIDDVFDVVATEGRIGKPVGNDIREGDITLPMLRIMQTGSENDQNRLRAIVGRDCITDDELAEALAILRSGDALSYSHECASAFIRSAKAALRDVPQGPAREMFHDIADYILSRNR